MDDRPETAAGGVAPDARAAGDPLAQAYDAYAGALYRYALMILADPSAAEDAVHQAFVKLVAMGRGLPDIRVLEGYLRVAVRNECYRMLRQRRSRRHMEAAAGQLLEPAIKPSPPDEQRLALEQALRRLPPEQREVVHLKIYEQMTFQQIADRLAVPLNTAASRYRYAIEKLRQVLDPDESQKDVPP